MRATDTDVAQVRKQWIEKSFESKFNEIYRIGDESRGVRGGVYENG